MFSNQQSLNQNGWIWGFDETGGWFLAITLFFSLRFKKAYQDARGWEGYTDSTNPLGFLNAGKPFLKIGICAVIIKQIR